MTIDPTVLQILIGVFGVIAIVILATNRIFLGSIIATIGQSFWFWVAYQAEQWGVIVVLSVQTLMFLLAIIGRWPRRPPPGKSDEHEWLGV